MLPRRFTTQTICLFFVINNFLKIHCSQQEAQKLQLHQSENREDMAAKKLFALDFEVYGKVQGVFFRKHTEKQAKQLGMHGWCMNTADGTVKGQLEGHQNEINEMKHWLQYRGSPKSRIDKAVFSETKEIPEYTFKTFAIKR